jgi:hypothetical protein
VNEGLQVLILLDPSMGIVWDVPNARRQNVQNLPKKSETSKKVSTHSIFLLQVIEGDFISHGL